MNKDLLNQIIQAILNFLGKKQSAPAPQPPTPSVPKVALKPITKEDLLMGRDKIYPSEYTAEVSANLDRTVILVNKIQDAYGKQLKVNSGWRSASINGATPGAAMHSNHMLGLACDFEDASGDLMRWTLANLDLMKELGAYMEDWRWTPTWTHYQPVPPKSGNRIFIPSAAPAIEPSRWSGKYLAKFN